MSDRLAAILLIVAALGIAGFVASRWIIYGHPAVTVQKHEAVRTSTTVHRNVVTVERVTTPAGEVRETTTRDLTTEEVSRLASLVSTSLSTPVFEDYARWGVTVGLNPKLEPQVGISVFPFRWLHLEAEIPTRLNIGEEGRIRVGVQW